jgi:hypothetical protein
VPQAGLLPVDLITRITKYRRHSGMLILNVSIHTKGQILTEHCTFVL